jgi:two-component system chemotaxis response regulator CheY
MTSDEGVATRRRGPDERRRCRSTTSLRGPTSPTMLLADGNAKTRAVYARSLRAAGWQVDEATDGRDALVKALTAPPHIVVTRVHLPLIDGSCLYQLLRRDHHTARVPIVAIADRPESNERTRAVVAGANAVLALPLLPEQLIDVSNSLLQRSAKQPHGIAAAMPSKIRGSHRRSMRSRQHTRFRTTSPPNQPRAMQCPLCDAWLKYDYSYVGGVNERRPEQWDVFVCVASANCGTFEYRHRTRKMRRLP